MKYYEHFKSFKLLKVAFKQEMYAFILLLSKSRRVVRNLFAKLGIIFGCGKKLTNIPINTKIIIIFKIILK